jgi:hypothetical protein
MRLVMRKTAKKIFILLWQEGKWIVPEKFYATLVETAPRLSMIRRKNFRHEPNRNLLE